MGRSKSDWYRKDICEYCDYAEDLPVNRQSETSLGEFVIIRCSVTGKKRSLFYHCKKHSSLLNNLEIEKPVIVFKTQVITHNTTA